MRWRQLMGDQRGLSFVEYLIVLCVVGLLGFGAWRSFGTMVSGEVSEARDDVSLVHAASVGSPGSASSGAGGGQGSPAASGGQSAALTGTSTSPSSAGGGTQGGSPSPSGVSVGLPSRPTASSTGSTTGALSAGGSVPGESGSASVVSNTSAISPGPSGRNRGSEGSGTHDTTTWSEARDYIAMMGTDLATGAVEGVKSALSGTEGNYDSTSELVGSVLGPVAADFAAPVAGVGMDIQDIRVAGTEFWENPGLGTGGWLLFVGTVGTVPGLGALAKGGARAARASGDVARSTDGVRGAAHRLDPSWRPASRMSDGRYDDQIFTMSGHGTRTDAEYPVRIFNAEELEARRVVAGPDGKLTYAQSGEFVHSTPNAGGEIDLMYAIKMPARSALYVRSSFSGVPRRSSTVPGQSGFLGSKKWSGRASRKNLDDPNCYSPQQSRSCLCSKHAMASSPSCAATRRKKSRPCRRQITAISLTSNPPRCGGVLRR